MMEYIFQYWIAREQVPNHKSLQNLTLLPLSTLHLNPNLAALAVHTIPFQKGELFLGLQQKILGETIYLWSTTSL
jgi:hypothetical protein